MAELTQIIETFEFLDDWDDRYAYITELGEQLPDMPAAEMVDANLVHGCMSKVWVTARLSETASGTVEFHATSDTSIIKGLVAILLSIFADKTPEQVQNADVDKLFKRLGIFDHLSPNRHFGVYAMEQKFKTLAEGLQ